MACDPWADTSGAEGGATFLGSTSVTCASSDCDDAIAVAYEVESGSTEGARAVYSVTLQNSANDTRGYFRLLLSGESTAKIPHDASAALVEDRLEALHSISGVSVTAHDGRTVARSVEQLRDQFIHDVTVGVEVSVDPRLADDLAGPRCVPVPADMRLGDGGGAEVAAAEGPSSGT